MLYQPSNLRPSSFGALGEGVIDASKQNIFTAFIEGTGAVEAYQLLIYQNTPESLIAYTSGKVVLAQPFYGDDYKGNKQVFRVTVPANVLENGYSNGYKWSLTVWENANDNDSAVSSVEQFFETAMTPLVMFVAESAPQIIESRSNIWKINYISTTYPARFQWSLAEIVNGERIIVHQTKWIYGTSQIWFQYDGLVNGKTYAVQAHIVNQMGVSSYSGWHQFLVQYNALAVEGATSIQWAKDGIQVGWGGIQYIEGSALYKSNNEPSDEYVVDNGECDIESNTYLQFESSETFDITCDPDSVIAFASTIDEYPVGEIVPLFEFIGNNGYHRSLEHRRFQVGLQPNDAGLTPDSSSLVPNDGVGGVFIYRVNDTIYEAPSALITLHKQAVIMKPNGLEVMVVE